MSLAAESTKTFDKILAEQQLQAASGSGASSTAGGYLATTAKSHGCAPASSSSSSSQPMPPPPSQPMPPPPQQPTKPKKEKKIYTDAEYFDIMAEAQVARDMNLKWRERGPPAPEDPSERWRGQSYRPGSGRWANRGGQTSWWFSEYYKNKRVMSSEALKAWVAQNPRPPKQ